MTLDCDFRPAPTDPQRSLRRAATRIGPEHGTIGLNLVKEAAIQPGRIVLKH